jgi:two-component system catabolic regulation response regulator CreB/two-component system response regulator ChvI
MTRILIVDDEEDNLNMFCDMLRLEGYTVDGYTDDNVALSDFKPDLYDVVILDYLLQGINGLQLYDMLREKDKSVRAVLLTASGELLEVGNIQDVIKKPIYPSQLVRKIREILSKSTTMVV